MINKWDKLIYDHYIKHHAVDNWMVPDLPKSPMEVAEIYEMIDRVYHADFEPRDDGSDMVGKIVQSPHFKLAAQSASRNVPRTLDLVEAVCKSLKQKDIDKNDDKQAGDFSELGARLENAMAGKDFAEDVKAAQEGAALAEDILGPWAGDGEGEDDGTGSLEDRKRLMAQLKGERFKTIASLFGEFKKHINSVARSKFIENSHIICDVELGNNFEKLLADEFMMFLPELEHLGNLRYVNQELMQFKTGSEEPVGKGDVAILVDVSSSMNQPFDKHERFDYAVACALAIHAAVIANGRECKLLVFNKSCREVSPVELLRYRASGGTDTQNALAYCHDVAGDMDAMVITDGEDLVENKSVQHRLYGLGIDYNPNVSHRLHEVCDSFFRAQSIDDFKKLSELVF